MKYLRQAIYGGLARLFTADKVYHRLAPTGTTMPYHTYKIDGSLRTLSTVYRENTHWDCNIRIESFGPDPDVLETRMRQIDKMMLYWEQDGIESGEIVMINPLDEDLDVEPDRDDDGNEVWHGTQIFTCYYVKGTEVSSSSSSSSST